MNFLSHYYFERNSTNSYEVLGCLLPDLVKNADKSWNIHPEKLDEKFYNSEHEKALLKGWKKHLAVDRIFHNTPFFFFHQHELKKVVTEIISDTPIKPFFVGHIALELCLDNLLITQYKINIENLYNHLESTDKKEIENFLLRNGIKNPEKFSAYFDSFKKEKYLKNYIKISGLSYAIKRICMRIWEKPMTNIQENELTETLSIYISHLKENFMIIFDEIELQLQDE